MFDKTKWKTRQKLPTRFSFLNSNSCRIMCVNNKEPITGNEKEEIAKQVSVKFRMKFFKLINVICF